MRDQTRPVWSGFARRAWNDKHLVCAEELIQLVDEECFCSTEGQASSNVDDSHVADIVGSRRTFVGLTKRKLGSNASVLASCVAGEQSAEEIFVSDGHCVYAET